MSSYYSPSIEKLIEAFQKLPSIGEKSAVRLAFYILNSSEEETNKFIQSIQDAKKNLKFCSKCFNISDTDPCPICSDPKRDQSKICVVEDVKDVVAMEKTHEFKGLYHVLHGSISPMDGIGPGDIEIDSLVQRVGNESIREVILALGSTMEGDTTNFYIYRKLSMYNVKVSIIARGISVGDELEYTDEVTLGRSILNRTLFDGK